MTLKITQGHRILTRFTVVCSSNVAIFHHFRVITTFQCTLLLVTLNVLQFQYEQLVEIAGNVRFPIRM